MQVKLQRVEKEPKMKNVGSNGDRGYSLTFNFKEQLWLYTHKLLLSLLY